MPCVTEKGKIFKAEAGRLAWAPDGNGGLYSALHRWPEAVHRPICRHLHGCLVHGSEARLPVSLEPNYCSGPGLGVSWASNPPALSQSGSMGWRLTIAAAPPWQCRGPAPALRLG